MAIPVDLVILGIELQEIIIKVENNDTNLKNINCVIKKLKGEKTKTLKTCQISLLRKW